MEEGSMDRVAAVRAFIRVVETGSFTKAAGSLELPRNTVTKLVQSLEARLQVKLLNRTTRRVAVTNDGASYYERMSRVVEEWDEVEADLAVTQNRPKGKLRVDMAALIATQLVIPALPAFYTQYPDIQLEIGVSDRLSDMVGDGVDCLVRAGRISDPSLIVRHIVDLPFVLCASQGYLKSYGKPRHPSELERNHAIVRYFFAGTGRALPLVLNFGKEKIMVRGQHLLAVNDANAQLAAGLAGLGILRILAAVAEPYIREGRLVPILNDWGIDPVPLSVVRSPSRHLSARLRVFLDWMILTYSIRPQKSQSQPSRRKS
jgi:DNA-binding transcriptional LysR family regulator